MFDVRCSKFDVQCSMFNVRCSMFDVQCSKFDVQYSRYDRRNMEVHVLTSTPSLSSSTISMTPAAVVQCFPIAQTLPQPLPNREGGLDCIPNVRALHFERRTSCQRIVVRLAVALLMAFVDVPSSEAQQTLASGDPSILPVGARLDTVFTKGSVMTEGVAAGHDGMIYFSDIPLTFMTKQNGPMAAGYIWRLDPRTGRTTVSSRPAGCPTGSSSMPRAA